MALRLFVVAPNPMTRTSTFTRNALCASFPSALFMPLLLLGLLVGQPAELSAQAFLPPLGGGGGGQFIANCPAGQNLTGFELRAADDVDAIRPVCVTAYSPRNSSAPSLTTDSGLIYSPGLPRYDSAARLAPGWYGGTGGKIVPLLCPEDSPIVIGMDVWSEGVTTIVVNNIHLFCGKAAAAQSHTELPSAVFDAPSYQISCGLTCGDDATRFYESQFCPDGQVAIGVHGRSGKWLDAMGLICGSARISPNTNGVNTLGKQGHFGMLGRPLGPQPPRSVCEAAQDARARTSPAAPNLEAQCRALPPGVNSIGRKNSSQPASAPIPVCDAARSARARNSPAAPNLEAQCRALGGSLVEAPGPGVASPDELAAGGENIANNDPLIAELRNRQPEGPNRRGFDIGIAAAETNTEWGPGKQKLLDSLIPMEQEGFKIAVSFSLDRNRNASLAQIGSAIAGQDPVVARARTAESDVRYWLGFDIATGIFGDPALGAQGNTALGPGAMKIRDALSAPGQRGFNAAVKLHLGRRY
jgi:hypothetical protein